MTQPEARIACESTAFAADAALCKSTLRTQLLAARMALPEEQQAAANQAIEAHVLAWWERCGSATLGVYWPIRGEPDLLPLFRQLAQCGVELALPMVVAREAPLVFAAWVPGQAMQADRFGIAIPAAPQRIVQPDTLLIPCVGVNLQRMRLGYGSGLYDRTLAALPNRVTVGIAYDCTKTEFPVAPHDIALQLVITESGIF